jgi:hypothetical protein
MRLLLISVKVFEKRLTKLCRKVGRFWAIELLPLLPTSIKSANYRYRARILSANLLGDNDISHYTNWTIFPKVVSLQLYSREIIS